MRTNMHTAAIVLAAGTAIALTTGTTGTVTSDAAADPGCPGLSVIAIPGTWETGAARHTTGPGMLAGVTDGLPASEQVTYVDYPATAFPWEGKVYGASQQVAVDTARELIRTTADRCPGTDFAVIGYSQGADAAGDLVAEIGRGGGVVRRIAYGPSACSPIPSDRGPIPRSARPPTASASEGRVPAGSARSPAASARSAPSAICIARPTTRTSSPPSPAPWPESARTIPRIFPATGPQRRKC
ncbi:cutinase family protein [Nocardia sp. AG03]|uniref:cutinase family protein n=1 Tax=Nocardia sp. AG03 TaxID=3025312 RepID=UPI00325A911C